MLAHEIMTPSPIVIFGDCSISEAIDLFISHRFKVLPVVDSERRPIGLVSQISMLQAQIKNLRTMHRRVESLKMWDATLVERDAAPSEVYQKLASAPSGRVLVRGEEGTLVGIIAPVDMMSRLRQKEGNEIVPSTEEADSSPQLIRYFDSIPLLIAVVDFRREITFINRAMKESLGDVLGQNFLSVIGPRDHAKANRFLAAIHDNGFLPEMSLTLLAKDGQKLRAHIQGTRSRDENGVPQIVLVARSKDGPQNWPPTE